MRARWDIRKEAFDGTGKGDMAGVARSTRISSAGRSAPPRQCGTWLYACLPGLHKPCPRRWSWRLRALGWLKSRRYGGGIIPPLQMIDAFRTVSAHFRGANERLRQFVDAQLLISAQTTSRYANALYGASALDLPRRGVVHLEGGIGAIAQSLAHGGLPEWRKGLLPPTSEPHPLRGRAAGGGGNPARRFFSRRPGDRQPDTLEPVTSGRRERSNLSKTPRAAPPGGVGSVHGIRRGR